MGDRLLAGRIGKPHGISGEVYVEPFSDDPQRFAPGAVLHHEDGRDLIVVGARRHRDRFLVSFEGVGDRLGAEGLRGTLYITTDERRSLDRDEYWPDDLIGCVVSDVDGAEHGTVSDVISNGAQDLLVLDDGSMIPMVAEIVRSVDGAAKRIVVDPPDGLLG